MRLELKVLTPLELDLNNCQKVPGYKAIIRYFISIIPIFLAWVDVPLPGKCLLLL